MSGRGRYRNHRNQHNNQHTLSSVARETAASLPANSPVLAMFKQAAVQLNERQDRHERLVKMSRDITIESKRIIFLLHSAITKEATEKAVQESKERLQKLVNGPIKSIGIELKNSPAYLHSRAVTAGFQEFIEAQTLSSLVEKKEIATYAEIQKEFTYQIESKTDGDEASTTAVDNITTLLPQVDYMLGLADLTGELMRRAINSIASGEKEECLHCCEVVQYLYTGYLGLFGIGKDLARKMSTTRANVSKVEAAVYALRVRGDAPLPLPPPVLPALEWESHDQHEDVDEGFY